MMNVLVLGSGGREHALAWSIAKSPQVGDLFIAPGNGGTVQCGRNVPLDPCDAEAVIGFSKDQGIGLVVIGPEAPLVAGVADAVRAAGIPVFGPNADAARLEGSKSFSKEFMIRHGLPTARYRACDCEADALAFVRETGAPIVVKADGLAAGKGVVVADDLEEAEEAVHDCFAGAFGTAGSSVVIEECLAGPECSMLAFITDGEAVCMPCAQDHKRAFDGDRGPNTGGMGAYSPVPAVDDALETRMADIMRTAAAATKEEFGAGYRGVLYGGFMLTEEGPKLLEFNARFGDPETQAVLARFDGDVLDAFLAVAEGRAGDVRPSWSDKVSVCVVLASGGYPGSYEKGKVILGIEEAEEMDGVLVFQAGTSYNADDELITSGGRVLNVVALADSFEEARELSYEACGKINFEGKQMRFDIAKRAIEV